MKKKLLSLLLCGAMMGTMLTACGNTEADSQGDTGDNQSEESSGGENSGDGGAEVTPEALPDAFAHYTFDGEDEGYVAVAQVAKADDSANDGATYDLAPVDVDFVYADGAVGKALYLYGDYGLDLNLQPTNTDVYTVSFWLNARFFFQFGPTLQIGYDIGKAADAGNNVTWMNITETTWGADSAAIFPMIWSRNEASDAQDGTDCWPWMYAWDDSVHGKNEWAMVTVVCSGEKQDGPLGTTTAGAQYYLNGQLMYDSQDNYTNHTYWEEWTWDASLAPNIMKPGDSEFESFFGVNYWDPLFYGYIDDLYVFDQALTAGQVLSLYELGDTSVTVEYPDLRAGGEETEEPTDPVAADHSDVTVTGTLVGATDCSTAFWTEFSDVVEVPEGESVTVNFKNYSSQLENWHNFLVVLQNVPEVHSADANADYKEYAVMRADNLGWGSGYDNIVTPECDWNWDTFKADIDGADVELTITNNGDTADVVAVVTTADGTVYNQSYKGIAVDGDLYYCLTLECAFLDIQ